MRVCGTWTITHSLPTLSPAEPDTVPSPLSSQSRDSVSPGGTGLQHWSPRSPAVSDLLRLNGWARPKGNGEQPFLHPVPTHKAEALPPVWLHKNPGAPAALDPTSSLGSHTGSGKQRRPAATALDKEFCHTAWVSSQEKWSVVPTPALELWVRDFPNGRGKNYEGMTDSWKTYLNILPKSES